MQLRDFLNSGGNSKLSVVAISWTEGRYGFASPKRLVRMVDQFHPEIRVIHETPEIVKSFSPLVYVPANFLFDAKGKRLFGDGNRKYLSREDISDLIKNQQ